MDILKQCFEENDSGTKSFLNKYCGKLSYDYENQDQGLTVSLPSNKNLYGAKALYCEYKINIIDEKSIKIESIKNWGALYMIVRYIDSDDDKKFTLGNEEKYVVHKPTNIKIIFYSNDIRNNAPFNVKMTETLSKANIVLITIIIFCVFVCSILCIIFYFYVRKQRLNMQRRNLAIIINNNNINRNYIIESNGFNSERNGLIKYIDNLKIDKFKDIKDKSINKNCPIEMTPFEDNSDVVLTECNHSFHYDCLKEHIIKNINLKEIKCFLCNNILYKPKNSIINSVPDLKTSPA